MPWWMGLLLAVACTGAAWRRAKDAQTRGSGRCVHEWGRAEAETGWDQKCLHCGAWKSGYGETWR